MNQYRGALSRALMKVSIGFATALAIGVALVVVPATSADALSAPASAHAATGGAPTAGTTAASKPKRASRGERVLRYARGRHGKPYRYGAAGPNSFDCSGLTRWVYRKVGVSLPHSSSAQVSRTYRVRHPKRGDLVFFYGRGGVYHVGIYAGHHSIWHAPYPGSHVKRERIWTHSYFIRRVKRH